MAGEASPTSKSIEVHQAYEPKLPQVTPKYTFNDPTGSYSRASLTRQGRQNDDKEVFFVFDEETPRALLSLNPWSPVN